MPPNHNSYRPGPRILTAVVEPYGQKMPGPGGFGRPGTGPFAPLGAETIRPRTMAYFVGAVYLFLSFSHASEFLDSSGRLHLVVLAALGSALAMISGGQLPASFRSKPGMAITLFTIFLLIGIPFSAWKGGSVASFFGMWWKSYLSFLFVSSLIFTVRQFRQTIFVMALASASVTYFAFKAMKVYGDGRVSVDYGSLGNSNDLAEALLVGLPFVLFVMVDKKRSPFIRIGFFAVSLFMLYVVFKSGSRSSMLGLGFMAFIVFLRASPGNKLKTIVLSAVLAVVFPMVAGKALMDRYKTMFSTEKTATMSDTAASAVESSQARRQLVYNGLELTAKHPIFGVGLGNFAMQSANLEMSKGRPPLWFTCHDIYLLVSSETGVAGFIFYVMTIISSFQIVRRAEKAAKQSPALADIGDMAFCLYMALIAFAFCGVFSTSAYAIQYAVLAGLAVAFGRITEPVLAEAERQRMEQFRQSLPLRPGRYTGVPAMPAVAR